MTLRRARPTVRLLVEDLTDGWESPHVVRALAQEDFDALHPLSELPHAVVHKSVECLGNDPDDDNPVGLIRCSEVPLLEVKASQWRAGVWEDSNNGCCWIIVAGLAKGGHQDHDDFYKRVERESPDLARWMPTAIDIRLLKRERAALLLTEWELGLQRSVAKCMREVVHGGEGRFTVAHPVPNQLALASAVITVEKVDEDDYRADEVVIELYPQSKYVGTDLLWQGVTRVLVSVHPPEQEWDRVKYTFSNIAEPGHWERRLAELDDLDAQSELAMTVPGSVTHYAHRNHISESVVNGTAIRALCGVHFVQTQSPESLPGCPSCATAYERLPR